MLDMTEVRTRLTGQLAVLTSQIDQIEGQFGRPLDDDLAEQAVEREDEEALDLIEHSALAEVERVKAAIARLDAGNYGLCTSCGADIAVERLRALPEAAECIGCATRHTGQP